MKYKQWINDMVVKPKIKIEEKAPTIDEIINKGADVIEDRDIEEKDGWTMISLRLPKRFLKIIDNTRLECIGLSRNAWILQAIQEKLEK